MHRNLKGGGLVDQMTQVRFSPGDFIYLFKEFLQ